jgi:hypothetical protein
MLFVGDGRLRMRQRICCQCTNIFTCQESRRCMRLIPVNEVDGQSDSWTSSECYDEAVQCYGQEWDHIWAPTPATRNLTTSVGGLGENVRLLFNGYSYSICEECTWCQIYDLITLSSVYSHCRVPLAARLAQSSDHHVLAISSLPPPGPVTALPPYFCHIKVLPHNDNVAQQASDTIFRPKLVWTKFKTSIKPPEPVRWGLHVINSTHSI